MKSVFAAFALVLFTHHASAGFIDDYAGKYAPTALMVVQNGQITATSGDIKRKVNVASVRKSLLCALYGIAVAEGRINLSSTLAELNIDDKPGLTASEKQAKIRDLLMARSGIYLPAAYETAEIKANRPPRGNHSAGSFWFYNNWDFNALGTIYRKTVGEDIFASFETRIARPIGMEDFTRSDGRYVLAPSSSHPAYPFTMSARDLARFGILMVKGGQWEGRQVIPADWIKESTATYSQTNRKNRGYGYLWWTLPDDLGTGAALASGYGGQLLAVVPSKQLVVVQVMAAQRPDGPRTADFIDLLREIYAAAP